MSNLPKPLYYIVVIAIALGAYFGGRFLMQAVITQFQLNQAVSRSTDPNSEPVVSTEEAKQQFIAGCMGTDLSGSGFNQQQYCGCTYDILENTKGVNWILKAGLNAQDPSIQAEIVPATTECLRQQNITL